MCIFLMKKDVSILEKKSDFMWPEELNTACMTRRLYLALQTMNKFLPPFLWGYDFNGKAGIFG